MAETISSYSPCPACGWDYDIEETHPYNKLDLNTGVTTCGKCGYEWIESDRNPAYDEQDLTAEELAAWEEVLMYGWEEVRRRRGGERETT